MGLLPDDGEGLAATRVSAGVLFFAAGTLAGRGAPWAMTGGCSGGRWGAAQARTDRNEGPRLCNLELMFYIAA